MCMRGGLPFYSHVNRTFYWVENTWKLKYLISLTKQFKKESSCLSEREFQAIQPFSDIYWMVIADPQGKIFSFTLFHINTSSLRFKWSHWKFSFIGDFLRLKFEDFLKTLISAAMSKHQGKWEEMIGFKLSRRQKVGIHCFATKGNSIETGIKTTIP